MSCVQVVFSGSLIPFSTQRVFILIFWFLLKIDGQLWIVRDVEGHYIEGYGDPLFVVSFFEPLNELVGQFVPVVELLRGKNGPENNTKKSRQSLRGNCCDMFDLL